MISKVINNMDIEYMDTDPEYWLTGDYGTANENLKIEDLTEVYVVAYTLKKKGSKEPEEIYTFTTDFEQALKRFKLLPHTKCFLKRVLTDSEQLIILAKDGTKPKVTEEEAAKCVDLKERIDMFRDEDDEGNPIYEVGVSTREATDVEMEHVGLTAPNTPEAAMKELSIEEVNELVDRHTC